MCGLIIWLLIKIFCLFIIFLGLVVLYGELILWIKFGCGNLKFRVLIIKIIIFRCCREVC